MVAIDNGRPSIRALQQGRKRAEKRKVAQVLNPEDGGNDEGIDGKDSDDRGSSNNSNSDSEGSNSDVRIIEVPVPTPVTPRNRRIAQPKTRVHASKITRPATRATTRAQVAPVTAEPVPEPARKRRRKA